MICTRRRQRTRLWWLTGAAAPARPAHLAGPITADDGAGDAGAGAGGSCPTLVVPAVLLVVLVIAWAVDTSSGGSPATCSWRASTSAASPRTSWPVAWARWPRTSPPPRSSWWSATSTYSDHGRRDRADRRRGGDRRQRARRRRRAPSWPARPVGLGHVARLGPTRRRSSSVSTRSRSPATVVELEGDDRTPPTEPTVELVDGAFTVVPGVDGAGIDPSVVADRLPGAAEAAVAEGAGTIRLELSTGPIPPLGSIDEARRGRVRRRGAGQRAARDPHRRRGPHDPAGPAALVGAPGQQPRRHRGRPLRPRRGRARPAAGLRRHRGPPGRASFTLEGGVPVIRPDQPGKVCCGGDPAADHPHRPRRRGTRSLELPLVDGPSSFTVADAEAYGIKEPVGGNNAWRSGAPTTAGSGLHDLPRRRPVPGSPTSTAWPTSSAAR